MKASTVIGVTAVMTMGGSGPGVLDSSTSKVGYHVVADVQDLETLDILSDPRSLADVTAGLEDIENGRLSSFEDLFGEPL